MDDKINDFLEWINDFMAEKPGILPMVGVVFIVVNMILQWVPGRGVWLVDSNVFLHIGLLLSIIGLLLVNVYRS